MSTGKITSQVAAGILCFQLGILGIFFAASSTLVMTSIGFLFLVIGVWLIQA